MISTSSAPTESFLPGPSSTPCWLTSWFHPIKNTPWITSLSPCSDTLPSSSPTFSPNQLRKPMTSSPPLQKRKQLKATSIPPRFLQPISLNMPPRTQTSPSSWLNFSSLSSRGIHSLPFSIPLNSPFSPCLSRWKPRASLFLKTFLMRSESNLLNESAS